MLITFADQINTVVVAQLVRAPDCDSGGRGFEPRLPPKRKASDKIGSLFLLLENLKMWKFEKISKFHFSILPL